MIHHKPVAGISIEHVKERNVQRVLDLGQLEDPR